MVALGEKIRRERLELGLTMEQFADLAGTSFSMLQRIETGAKSPPVDLLLEIANICRKPYTEFIDDTPRGFRKFDPTTGKLIKTDNTEVAILCPYGLLSRDLVVSIFKGRAGTVLEPKSKHQLCWVYITKGKGIFIHDGVSHPLEKGDSLYYDARRPHSIRLLTAFESIRITVSRPPVGVI